MKRLIWLSESTASLIDGAARLWLRRRQRLLAPHAGSRKVAELTDALNDASASLQMQLEETRRTEERTQSILNAVPDAIIGLDAEGCVALVSPAAANVFGHDAHASASPSLADWLPGLDLSDIERRTSEGLFMRASGLHVARFETIARRRDGTEFPADVSLSRADADAGTGLRYTCVVRDITEQRMAFAMLNLYSRALDCTSNGVVISDMALPGNPVFYANPAFYKITGYDPGDAIGRNCGFLQREDTAQPELGQLREAVSRGESCTVVLRNYRKDGALFFNELAVAPVRAPDGSVPHYVGVLNDVTERERTRMAIAVRSARLNAVFDLSPDGFVVFDADTQLVYSNRAFLAMTGWNPVEAGGPLSLREFDLRFAMLTDPALPTRSLAEVLKSSENTADTLSLLLPERRVLARDVRGQLDGKGETILFLRDVTRETEVDRMKSEFLTTAAHELRTPMVSVFGFTELLLNRPVSEPKRRDMLETIHRQSQLLINMVNELLDLARIEARQGKDLKRQPCRLGTLVEQAVAPFQGQAEAGQGGAERLRLNVAHADAMLYVDDDKALRAFTNVLSNAFKYTPDGGAVSVETLDGELRDAPAVGVRVTDAGIGMSPEQLRRVFERFYRADPSGNIPGSGLGMSLVKEIVELHGGRVEIESEPGRGTTVTLWLPLVREAAAA